MLGQPALVAGHHRGDAQREALLAQQRVAAVAGAVGPDLALSGKWTMYFVVGCTATARLLRPARAACRPSAGTARTRRRSPSASSTRLAHAGHDPHVDDDVGRVGELHADLRDRRAERPHAEGDHVHRAAAHAAVEEPVERAPASRRVASSCWSGRRRPALASRCRCGPRRGPRRSGIRAGQEAVRALVLGSSRMNVPASTISSHSASYSSCEPSHQWTVGLGEGGDLLHPCDEPGMGGGGGGMRGHATRPYPSTLDPAPALLPPPTLGRCPRYGRRPRPPGASPARCSS